MNITLGFSPCPNDTYMLAALLHGWVETYDIIYTPAIEDVETLNTWAAYGKLDVTKMSFHRALTLEDRYKLLSAGAALGHGCGPLLIAKKTLTQEEINQGPTALPGDWTTAHLLFKLFYPEATNKEFILFSDIEDQVLKGEVIAGVIIHENRFTYAAKGLEKIVDLGEAWEHKTSMPIPLGGLFASTQLSHELIPLIEKGIRESILFSRKNPEKVMPFVRSYSQEMEERVMAEHIGLYVNDYSLDLGQTGLKAVQTLKYYLDSYSPKVI